MLHLPNVTLVLIETRQHELARLAVKDCLALAKFGDVLVFTDRPLKFLNPDIAMIELGQDGEIITVPDWEKKIGWSRFNWQEVAPYIRTSHVLGIQWDSWIVDPGMWRDEFLAYDYVGAPWWYKDGMNVGNGGFCLRSTKLLRYVRKHRDRFPCINDLDDDLICRRYRPVLQDAGFIWAPESVAIDFAFECVRLFERNRHFGFHAAYNFDYGCSGDRDRILERARIMAASKYMTVTNPYIWDGFVKSNPWVVDEMKKAEAS